VLLQLNACQVPLEPDCVGIGCQVWALAQPWFTPPETTGQPQSQDAKKAAAARMEFHIRRLLVNSKGYYLKSSNLILCWRVKDLNRRDFLEIMKCRNANLISPNRCL